MPYFGGSSLARVLERLAGTPPARRTGRDLACALEAAGEPGGAGVLAGLSYVQAVCHVGACLADALAYAHSRRLIHLDVKSSNVLLAADGQPMLLDFHLAREPLPAGAVVEDELGGTFAYMAPEQRRAVEAVARGQPLPCAVDHRADVYALGMLLYEALAGQLPSGPGRTRLDRLNPRVSVGLADLVEKSLSADPDRRQLSAAELGDDLRRHLRDLPLRTVANRSLRERWRKWRRREPSALRGNLLLGAVALALAAFAFVLAADYRHRIDEAERALLEGREQSAERGLHEEALATLRRGLEHLRYLPGSAGLAAKLADEMALAQRRLLLGQLHDLAEKMRGLAGMEVSDEGRRRLDARCRAFWERRRPLVEELRLHQDAAAARDFLDVLLVWQERLGGRPWRKAH
jgi:hypothetical protein